jgi:hypothetical protein
MVTHQMTSFIKKTRLDKNIIGCLPPMFAFMTYEVSIYTGIIIAFLSAVAFLGINQLASIFHDERVFLLLLSQKHSSA